MITEYTIDIVLCVYTSLFGVVGLLLCFRLALMGMRGDREKFHNSTRKIEELLCVVAFCHSLVMERRSCYTM